MTNPDPNVQQQPYGQPQYQQPYPPQQPYGYQVPPPQYGYQQNPRQGRDGAQYVRQQHAHSLMKHLLLCMVGVGLVTIPYYSMSPNHYWKF